MNTKHMYMAALEGFYQQIHVLNWMRDEEKIEYLNIFWGDSIIWVRFHADDVTLEHLASLGVFVRYSSTIPNA